MQKIVYIVYAVMVQLMFAFAVAVCIIAIYNHELVIALLCAAMRSCLVFMWREVEKDIKQIIEEEKHEGERKR